jgi:UDP-glucose 4-epimerase
VENDPPPSPAGTRNRTVVLAAGDTDPAGSVPAGAVGAGVFPVGVEDAGTEERAGTGDVTGRADAPHAATTATEAAKARGRRTCMGPSPPLRCTPRAAPLHVRVGRGPGGGCPHPAADPASTQAAVPLATGQDEGVATVLLTGSAGLVGRSAASALTKAGWEVRTFDLLDGADLRDDQAVLQATEGCEAIVHAGAIPHDSRGTPAAIMATNVLGTWHVLLAAERHRIARVVYLSSVQVFGCAEGEGDPAYLPIDDVHPLRAARPYGLSKRLAEVLCEAWTLRTGISTVVLRPVLVVSGERVRTLRRDEVELDAFVHVDDVADAIVRAVVTPVHGHVRAILCGPGQFSSATARDILGWKPTVLAWPAEAKTAIPPPGPGHPS